MDNEAIVKLSKDMKTASSTMTRNESRYLISQYLTMQNNRKAADQKAGKMEERAKGEPHAVLNWISDNAYALEKQILGALKCFAESQPMGKWAMAIDGIGPVVAAGLLAHIDIEKCPTVGHIWAFMGYDPSKEWKKGEKRPHNAALKQIGYYAGESFVKCTKSPYRKLYDDRKAYEHAKNDAGEYAELAAKVLKARPTHAQAKTYKAGKLPDGHIHSRAKRYAVKQFIADWWTQAYRDHFKKEPPLPYPIAILGHAHLRKAA
jgi:hypothetical protein